MSTSSVINPPTASQSRAVASALAHLHWASRDLEYVSKVERYSAFIPRLSSLLKELEALQSPSGQRSSGIATQELSGSD